MQQPEPSEEELDLLLERVRQQSSTGKSWSTLIKTARNNMMEKKNVLDAEDKAQLKQSLDYLQKFRRVFNRKDLFGHLKDLVHPQEISTGLKFSHMSGNTGFISKAEFYVEISAPEDNGRVGSVIVAHEKIRSESQLLLNLLNDCQWDKFMEQINNLNQFYPDSRDSTIRVQVFKSLTIMEDDISTAGIKETCSKVDITTMMESQVGIVQGRDAGSPLKILYFCTPYDLLNLRERAISSTAGSSMFLDKIGHRLEVVVTGASTNYLLPQSKTITAALGSKSTGVPSLSPDKGSLLPAHFTIKLSQPIPILNSYKNHIESITKIPVTISKTGNLMSFLLDEELNSLSSERGFFVNLSDQTQRYLIEVDSHRHLSAHLLSAIGVTDMASLLQVIACLRKQLKFNSAVHSFVRKAEVHSRQKKNAYHVFVSAPSAEKVECVVQLPRSIFENQTNRPMNAFSFRPLNFSVEVKEIREDGSCFDQPEDWKRYASKVFAKTWSIPVTIRAVCKKFMDAKYGLETNSSDQRDGSGLKREHGGDDSNYSNDNYCGGNPKKSGTDYSNSSSCPKGSDGKPMGRVRMSSAWLPSKSPCFYKDPSAKVLRKVTFSVERPIVGSACLLDIFKEPESWKELIPPKMDQIPIKSPVPFFPAASTASRLHEMLASSGGNIPSPQIPASVSNRQGQGAPSVRGRHLSSSSSDTFAEMDSICKMATEAYGGHQSVEGGTPGNETPGGNRPPGQGRYERKNSIQDVVDIVASGSPFSQPDISPGSASSMPPPSQSPQVQQSPQPGSQHGTPSPVSSIFPTQPKLLHSKSVELDLLAQQQHIGATVQGGLYPRPPFSARLPTSGGRMDIFEFRDELLAQDGSRAQPFQNPLLGPGGAQPTNSQIVASFGNFGQLGQPVTGTTGRGRGRGTGRRRSKKNPGNVGDRQALQPGMEPPVPAAKKPRGAGTRKPRRPRGTGHQSHALLAPTAQMGSVPMPLKFPDVQKIEVDEKWNTQRSNFNSLPKVAEDWIKKAPDVPISSAVGVTVGSAQPAAKVSGAGLEDSDDSDSAHGDQKLRQEIQDFMVSVSSASVAGTLSGATSESSPTVPTEHATAREAKPASANVFEHLQNLKSTVPSSPASEASPSSTPRAKPNILAKNPPQRKGSLDLIAGKLMAKAGANPFGPQAGASTHPIELSDDEGSSQETLPAYRKKNATTELSDDVFTTIDADPPTLEEERSRSESYSRKESGATNSPADSEGIRLVIKKNQLKTAEREQGSRPLLKQKISSSSLGGPRPQKISSKKPIVSGSQSNDPRSAALQAAKARVPGAIGKKRKTDEGFKRANSEKVLKPLAKKLEKQASVSGTTSSSAETALKGICFTQTLKGFRIPKVVEEKPKEPAPPPQPQPKPAPPEPPPPQQQPPSLPRENPRPFPPQIRPALVPRPVDHPVPIQPKPPKSILKQGGSSSMPPKLQAEISPGAVRPGGGRKTLLPIPRAVGPPPVPPKGPPPAWNAVRPEFPGFQTATIVPLHNPFTESEPIQRTSSPQESTSIRSPDADTIQSPDDAGNGGADDSKSPMGLNTSKDSGDRSPGLAIVMDADGDQS